MKHTHNSRLLLVFYETTTACELNCIHCRANASLERAENELSTAEAKDLILEISNIEGVFPMLIFTGGNPMLRPDLFELMEYARENRVAFSLSPAVTDRLDDTALEKIRKEGVSSISISLDGSNSKIHNGIRRYDSFDRTVELIRRAMSMGINVQVNTTVMKQNVMDLPEILSLLVDLKVPVWEVFFLVKTGRGTTAEEITALEFESVNLWLASINLGTINVRTVEGPSINRLRIQRLREVNNFDVELFRFLHGNTDRSMIGTGFNVQTPRQRIETLFISSTGEVYPSGFLPVRIGNIREKTLYSMYRSSSVLETLRKMGNNVEGKCGYCGYRTLCGGSRARAFAATRNYLSSDPLCPYVPEIAY